LIKENVEPAWPETRVQEIANEIAGDGTLAVLNAAFAECRKPSFRH